MTSNPGLTRRELGLLIIVILKAQHLPDPHRFSKQDPFVIAELGEGADVQAVRTQTDRGGGQHPLWDEEFRIKLYEEEGKPNGQKLTLKMMRKEGVRAKDEELIGEATVLIDGKRWREFDEWIELKTPEGKFAGEIYLEMTFYPLEVQKQRPAASDLQRHRSKLDLSTRTPLPTSLRPGGGGGGGDVSHSISNLQIDDQHLPAPSKALPPVPQLDSPGLLPLPGEPEYSHSLPQSLRPGSSLQQSISLNSRPNLSADELPLPGDQRYPPQFFDSQQSLHPSSYSSQNLPTPGTALSSSPGQYTSWLSQPPARTQHQPASYPSPAPGSRAPNSAPHSTSYPQSYPSSYPPPPIQGQAYRPPSSALLVSTPPPVPPRPSSAASSITDTMHGSFYPNTNSARASSPSPSPNRPPVISPPAGSRLTSSSPSPAPSLPPRQYSPSPSPSTSSFPSGTVPSHARPPLPPNPAGNSTPSFSPSLDSKHREAAQEQATKSKYEPPPPAYPVPTSGPSSASVRRTSAQQEAAAGEEEEEEKNRARRRELERVVREAREAEEEEEAAARRVREREEEEMAKRERERISEERKLARIREAQEARARKLAQEREDERLAFEAEERERAAERERRDRERQADEEFVAILERQEREREDRERRDEELAKQLREDEEADRTRREREDEEYVKRLREEDQRLEAEERRKRLVEDERLARTLAEREHEEEERRRSDARAPTTTSR